METERPIRRLRPLKRKKTSEPGGEERKEEQVLWGRVL